MVPGKGMDNRTKRYQETVPLTESSTDIEEMDVLGQHKHGDNVKGAWHKIRWIHLAAKRRVRQLRVNAFLFVAGVICATCAGPFINTISLEEYLRDGGCFRDVCEGPNELCTERKVMLDLASSNAQVSDYIGFFIGGLLLDWKGVRLTTVIGCMIFSASFLTFVLFPSYAHIGTLIQGASEGFLLTPCLSLSEYFSADMRGRGVAVLVASSDFASLLYAVLNLITRAISRVFGLSNTAAYGLVCVGMASLAPSLAYLAYKTFPSRSQTLKTFSHLSGRPGGVTSEDDSESMSLLEGGDEVNKAQPGVGVMSGMRLEKDIETVEITGLQPSAIKDDFDAFMRQWSTESKETSASTYATSAISNSPAVGLMPNVVIPHSSVTRREDGNSIQHLRASSFSSSASVSDTEPVEIALAENCDTTAPVVEQYGSVRYPPCNPSVSLPVVQHENDAASEVPPARAGYITETTPSVEVVSYGKNTHVVVTPKAELDAPSLDSHRNRILVGENPPDPAMDGLLTCPVQLVQEPLEKTVWERISSSLYLSFFALFVFYHVKANNFLIASKYVWKTPQTPWWDGVLAVAFILGPVTSMSWGFFADRFGWSKVLVFGHILAAMVSLSCCVTMPLFLQPVFTSVFVVSLATMVFSENAFGVILFGYTHYGVLVGVESLCSGMTIIGAEYMNSWILRRSASYKILFVVELLAALVMFAAIRRILSHFKKVDANSNFSSSALMGVQ